jgi:hypothetical protein
MKFMFISVRSTLVRNFCVAAVNGAITLVILLIAPLGLAAVLMNTALVMLSTLVTATAADRVILFLRAGQPPQELSFPDRPRSIRRADPGPLDRR